MQRRLIMLRRHQGGLTLVELMIAIVLVGIVTGAITMVISDVFSASARTSNHMTAVRQVQSAEYWLSRDVRQARAPIYPEFPLVLTIPYRVGEGHETEEEIRTVVYQVVDGRLRRTSEDQDSDPITTIVAEHIDEDQTSLYWDDERALLVFTVTATVRGQSETREYEIKPRLASSDGSD